MKIEFFIPMQKIPTTTHQEKRISSKKSKSGKAIVYEAENLKAARAKFMAELAVYRPPEPISGPVGLLVHWGFPLTIKAKNGEWKTSKPDTDNMIKLLKDCMTQLGFWSDDAQVCYEVSMKKYAEVSGVFISVQTIGGEQNG